MQSTNVEIIGAAIIAGSSLHFFAKIGSPPPINSAIITTITKLSAITSPKSGSPYLIQTITKLTMLKTELTSNETLNSLKATLK